MDFVHNSAWPRWSGHPSPMKTAVLQVSQSKTFAWLAMHQLLQQTAQPQQWVWTLVFFGGMKYYPSCITGIWGCIGIYMSIAIIYKDPYESYLSKQGPTQQQFKEWTYSEHPSTGATESNRKVPFFVDHSESLGIQSYSQMMIRVSNHLLNIVFRFHYHSQKLIGSLGNDIPSIKPPDFCGKNLSEVQCFCWICETAILGFLML